MGLDNASFDVEYTVQR